MAVRRRSVSITTNINHEMLNKTLLNYNQHDQPTQEPAIASMHRDTSGVYHFLSPTGYSVAENGKENSSVIWEGFKESTSVHGIPHVDRAPGIFKKMFWLILSLATFAALLYNITNITSSFFSFSVNVRVEILHETEMTFPSVTICNMSPVRKSAYNKYMKDKKLANQSNTSKKRKKRAVSSCSSGFLQFDNACFSMRSVTETYTFDQAILEIKNTATDAFRMVIMDSVQRSHFITSNYYNVGDGMFWSELMKDPNSGSWITRRGDLMTNDNVWEQNEPLSENDCSVFNSATYLLKSVKCTSSHYLLMLQPVMGANSTSSLTTAAPSSLQFTLEDTTYSVWTLDNANTIEMSTIRDPSYSQTTTTTTTQMSTTHTNIWTNTSTQCNCCTSCPSSGKSDDKNHGPTEPDWWDEAPPTTTQEPSTTPTTTTSQPAHGGSTTTKASTTTTSPPTTTTSKYPERVQTSEVFQEQESFTENLADISMEDKISVGTRYEDLVLDCEFSGQNCTEKRNFHTFYNPIHGNCFMFNSIWNQSSERLFRAYKAGRRFGLQLILNIDQDEYTSLSGDTAGLRMVIHQAERMPFPEDEGINIAPGHSTSVGMRELNLIRLEPPYGKCRHSQKSQYESNVYEELYPTKYSSSACYKTCYQRHVITTCKCGDAYYPMTGNAFPAEPVSACKTKNIEQDSCRYDVRKRFSNNELECDCPPSCDEKDYSLLISTGQWPSDVQQYSVIKKLRPKIKQLLSDRSDKYKYKRNLIKLEVYFEQFNVERISEREAYAVENYLSDIGGVLGLWLGCSILTIAEFIELLMDLIVLMIIRRCSKDESTKKNTITPNPTVDVTTVTPIRQINSKRDSLTESLGVSTLSTPRRREIEMERMSPPPRYDSSEKLVDSFILPGTVQEENTKPKSVSNVTSGRLTVKSLHNV